jgi:hypothetical protein
MASLPPQSGAQPQRRRSSPNRGEGDSDQLSCPLQEDTTPLSYNAADPLIVSAPSTSQNPASSTLSPSQAQTTADHSNHTSDVEPRKCWICYTDETEDTPLSSQWRSPCPCALTAHESCLLDWVADLENPKNRKRRHGSKIECPQCKNEIHIARPRSLALEAMRYAEGMASKLVLPGVGLTLLGMIWAGATAHGYYSMNLVFGTEDTERILQRGMGTTLASAARLNAGLFTIPVVLISSRVSYTESLLPVIPLFFFGSYYADMESLNSDIWPPSAAMTFAILPYVRVIYNKLYEKLFAPLEQKWLKEVQPRAGEDDGDGGNGDLQNGGADEEGARDDFVMQLNVEVQVLEDEDEDQAAAPPLDIVRQPPPLEGQGLQNQDQNQNQEQNEGDQNENGQQNQNGNAQQNANPQPNELQRGEINFSSLRLADTILGALLFPTISAAMGQLLRLGLPKRLTVAPRGTTKPGLLQSRWGRSVVGGCLFVVIKDVLVLYCRWKLAENHRQRKVLNWEGGKGKKGKGVRS